MWLIAYFLEMSAMAVGKKSKAFFCSVVVSAGVFRKQDSLLTSWCYMDFVWIFEVRRGQLRDSDMKYFIILAILESNLWCVSVSYIYVIFYVPRCPWNVKCFLSNCG